MSTSIDHLKNEFNLLLIEYKDTYQKYVDVLISNDENYMEVPNSYFLGKNNLKVLANSNLLTCASSCFENNLCSGATFNKSSNECILSSGRGTLINATNTTAITPEVLYYSKRLKELNEEMRNINKQIKELSENNNVLVSETNKEVEEQENILINNNQILIDDRDKIEDMTRQFQTLDAAYNDKAIMLTASYYKYIVLMFVIIFLIVLLIKYLISTPQFGQDTYLPLPLIATLLIVVIIVILLVNTFQKR